MKYPPTGFIKMGLSLLLNQRAVKVFEQHTLRMVLRDYYIFYTKEKKIAGLIRVHLYCRDKDEACIAYNIGIYNQTMLDFQTKKKIIYAGHSIPKDYLKQIHIKDVFDPTAPPQPIISPKEIAKNINKYETRVADMFPLREFTKTYYDKKQHAVYFLINQSYIIGCRKKNNEGAFYIINEKEVLQIVREEYKMISFEEAVSKSVKMVVGMSPDEYELKFSTELIKVFASEILKATNKNNKTKQNEKPKSSRNR